MAESLAAMMTHLQVGDDQDLLIEVIEKLAKLGVNTYSGILTASVQVYLVFCNFLNLVSIFSCPLFVSTPPPPPQ